MIYDSDFGRVFYERSVWPSDDEDVVMVVMKDEGAATSSTSTLYYGRPWRALITSNSISHLDAPLRHHSRLQLNNYPSQIVQLHYVMEIMD